jgi:hypothetical protein
MMTRSQTAWPTVIGVVARVLLPQKQAAKRATLMQQDYGFKLRA